MYFSEYCFDHLSPWKIITFYFVPSVSIVPDVFYILRHFYLPIILCFPFLSIKSWSVEKRKVEICQIVTRLNSLPSLLSTSARDLRHRFYRLMYDYRGHKKAFPPTPQPISIWQYFKKNEIFLVGRLIFDLWSDLSQRNVFGEKWNKENCFLRQEWRTILRMAFRFILNNAKKNIRLSVVLWIFGHYE